MVTVRPLEQSVHRGGSTCMRRSMQRGMGTLCKGRHAWDIKTAEQSRVHAFKIGQKSCVYKNAVHQYRKAFSFLFLFNKRESSPHNPLVLSMVLGHLLRRVRALVGRTWNKDEDIHANENPSLNKAEPDELCWICLEGASSDANLVQHCACPRVVHDKCMARWQLQSAGKE